MKTFLTLLNLIFVFTLSGCYMDAHIGEIISSITTAAEETTVAVAPSVQYKAVDQTTTYRAQSAVGEVTTGVTETGDGIYRADISITYQRL